MLPDDAGFVAEVTPDADLPLLARLNIEGDDEVRVAIAIHSAADEALLIALAGRNDHDVSRALLRRPALPLTVLCTLVSEDSPVTMERVRLHPSYPILAAFQRRVYLVMGAGVLLVVGFLVVMAVLFPATD